MHYQQNYKLTNCKFSLFWGHSTLFNWILHKTSVVTFVNFLHTLNSKGAGAFSQTEREPRVIAVNVCTFSLPLKPKIISCGFNIESCVCFRRYCLVLRMLCDLRGINCKETGLYIINTNKLGYIHYFGLHCSQIDFAMAYSISEILHCMINSKNL